MKNGSPWSCFLVDTWFTGRICCSHCRDAGNDAADADILIERPSCTDVREIDSFVQDLRAISSEGTSTLRAQREVNDTPSEHNTLTRATVYRSRGRHNIDLQYIHREYFNRRERTKNVQTDANLHAIIHN